MTYKVEFSKEALKELKKLDKYDALFITKWIRKNLEGSSNPRQHGKGLKDNLSGMWRYRVGNYRIISDIQESRIVILILNIKHRKDAYK